MESDKVGKVRFDFQLDFCAIKHIARIANVVQCTSNGQVTIIVMNSRRLGFELVEPA